MDTNVASRERNWRSTVPQKVGSKAMGPGNPGKGPSYWALSLAEVCLPLPNLKVLVEAVGSPLGFSYANTLCEALG